jgi:hypothetical protein
MDGECLGGERPVVVDLTTGREVLRGRPSSYAVRAVAWAPASDAVVWLQAGAGVLSIRSANVPSGTLVDLDAQGEPHVLPLVLARNVCFGRSGRELIVGFCRVGLPKDEASAYEVMDVLPDQSLHVTGTLRSPPTIPAHWPMQMVRVGDGRRILVVDGLHGAPPSPRGQYLLDLADRSVTRAVSESTPAVLEARRRWGAAMADCHTCLLVPGWPEGAFVFGLRVPAGREYFKLDADGGVSVQRIGFVPGGGERTLLLSRDKGLVVAIGQAGREVRLKTGTLGVSNLHAVDPQLREGRALTIGDVCDEWPLWSAAVGRVVFLRNRQGVWTVSLSAGDARRVYAARPK